MSSYFFEIYLYFKYQNKNNLDLISKSIKDEYYNNTGKEYDTRNILEVFDDLIKDNRKVSVNLGDIGIFLSRENPNLKLFPLSPSIPNSKIILCNENGYYAIYTSDRYGFNNPDDQWDKKIIDYVLIGDSFVEGDCVNRPEDMSSVIRAKSNKTTLNLGVGGSGILIQLAILEEYLKNKDVKNLILFFYEGNDLKNLKNELNVEILRNYLFEKEYSQELMKKQDMLNFVLEEYFKKVYESLTSNTSHLIQSEKNIKDEIIKGIKLYRARGLIFKPQMDIQGIRVIFKKDKNICSKKTQKFILFIYLNLEDLAFYYNEKQFNQIKNLVLNQGIIFIDTVDGVFAKENRALDLFPLKIWTLYSGGI